MNKYAKTMFNFFGITINNGSDKPPRFSVANHYRNLSETEVSSLIEQVNIRDHDRVVSEDIPKLLEPLTKDLQNKRIDNEKLIALAPEIDQAAAILIPSILSPNDMRTTQFYLNIKDDAEDTTTLAAVTELLYSTFRDELKLNTKLFHWLNLTMFRHGAKPLLILPSYVLSYISDLTDREGSLESLYYEIDATLDGQGCTEALESIKDSVPIKGTGTDDLAKNAFGASGELKFTMNMEVLTYADSKRSSVTDTIDKATTSARAAQESVGSRFRAPFINIADIITSAPSDTFSQPSIIELPYESTIPIIIDGAPDNHIGYFIILNEQGVPISAKASETDDDNGSSGSKRIDTMYKSFYGTSQATHMKKASDELKATVVETIYSQYLSKMIDGGLKSVGLSDFSVKLSNDTIGVMFTRLLRQTNTRALFVPAKYLVYLALEYNANGTGRSRIDNIKFPLSLKLTLIITRLISLVEASVNRRKVNITFDDSVANPVETLQMIKKELLAKKMHGISYDPNTIISSSLDKTLTVVPNNIPGVENFDISEEANNVNYPSADDSLMEEINNMYTLSLGVSANSLNRFNNDELAISVATNNLFMSNQIVMTQTSVSESMTKLVTTYTRNSSHLRSRIAEIIKSSSDGGDEATNIEERVSAIINSIEFSLPKPNMAFDRSQHDNVSDFMRMVDDMLNTLLSGDLMDRDSEEQIKRLRAYTKRSILSDYLTKNTSFGTTFSKGVFKDTPIIEMTDITMTLLNFSKALADIKKAFSDSDASNSQY